MTAILIAILRGKKILFFEGKISDSRRFYAVFIHSVSPFSNIRTANCGAFFGWKRVA